MDHEKDFDSTNGCKEIMRVRSDGDYDIVKVIYGEKGVEKTEEIVRTIPAADKDFPNGRPVDSQTSEENRSLRTEYLMQSDWTQTADVPTAIKSAWTAYRKALRDLPNHKNWPNIDKADWPVKPD